MKELLIAGGGPAGLTASIYSARKKLDFTLITENIGGQALWGSDIDNYLGYHMIPGLELVKRFDEHVKQFEIEKSFDSVIKVSNSGNGFYVKTKKGKELEARTVIIATGKKPRQLAVPGEKEFHGKGVTYCSTCDAPLFSGLPTMVVGGGNSGLEAALQLATISPRVYLVTENGLTGDNVTQEKIRRLKNVEVRTETKVAEIKGDKLVGSVIVEGPQGNKKELEVKGIFVEAGAMPNIGFLQELVNFNAKMEIKVNCRNETAAPGLFAAGDVTNVPEKQIIVAAGEGAKASLTAYTYLATLRD